MAHRIGFIGGGNMSTAIVKGILRNDDLKPHSIWVSGPNLKNLQHWKEMGTNVTTKNGELFATCDIVFLGVKPGILDIALTACLDDLPETLNPIHVIIISMLAGINIERLREALKVLPKNINVKIIRIMPNTPMMVGVGSCLYSPEMSVSQEECLFFEKLLNKCAVVERIPETMIDSLGALTGCGPAFIYIIIEALADGAVKQGVPRAVAIRQAAQMVSGSAQMVLDTGKHPGQLKDEVCSPGGSTICGVTTLESGRIRATLINAIEAATLRTRAMGAIQK